MTDLRAKLSEVERSRLLRYIAAGIHGFTVMARDPDGSPEAKAAINNRIHYLAGHLMALADPKEPLTQSRLDGVVELVGSLNRRLAENMVAQLES